MRETLLILHFIGLAMGLGTSIGMLFLGIAGSKLPQDESVKFMLRASSLTRMGHIGLGLLIITGGALMTPYWSHLGDMPLMMAKLVLVLILTALIGVLTVKIKKAKGGDLSQMKSAKSLGPVALLTTLAIVVLAVLVFH